MKKLGISFALVLICLSAPTLVFAGDGSLRGRVIVLDPGHGVGAPGGGAYAGYVEHVRMLFLGHLIRTELESRGATVHMTRTTSDDVYITLRPAMTNRWSLEALRADRLFRLNYGNPSDVERHMLNVQLIDIDYSLGVIDRIKRSPEHAARLYMNYPFDHDQRTAIHPSWQRIFELQDDPLIRYNWLFISLHSNAPPIHNPAVNGADVFYMPNAFYFANYSHQDLERKFGEMLLDNIAPLGIRRNRVRDAHFLVVRETNIPAVLVENGYHTNERDRALLLNDDFMRNLAVVYADTIEAYFAAINLNRPASPHIDFGQITPPGQNEGQGQNIEQNQNINQAQNVIQAQNLDLIPNRHYSIMNAPITRGELARLVVLVYESIRGYAIGGRVHFTDTSSVYVQKAAYIGIMGEVSPSRFMPDNRVTREQAAVVLSRLATALGSPLPASGPDFTDNARISSWAALYVGRVQAAGILGAREFTFFVPQYPITLAQAETALRLLANRFGLFF